MAPMLYDQRYFDTAINRRGSNSVKWDGMKSEFGREDLVPMWVADMDFPASPEVQSAIRMRMEHASYGYTLLDDEDLWAVCGWLSRRHRWEVDPSWVLCSPGVITSLRMAVMALTQEGDGVVIQPPVYPPFFQIPTDLNRKLVENPLRLTDKGWEMDFDHLEDCFAQGAKMLLLCSPHNPVGRVWRRDELETLHTLCQRYGVLVVTDEIHADFAFPGHVHIPFSSLPGADDITVSAISATKSFNLAGLQHSSIIVSSNTMRAKMQEILSIHGLNGGNIFGMVAQQAVYEIGDDWLDGLRRYLLSQRDFALRFMQKNLPEIKIHAPQGTYMMWLDFTRIFGKDNAALRHFLVNEARVGLSFGHAFGSQGAGFARMNFACPWSQLGDALNRLTVAMQSRREIFEDSHL